MKHVDRHRPRYREAGAAVFDDSGQRAETKSQYWKTAELFAATLDQAVQQRTIREVNTLQVATMFLDSIRALMAHQVFSPAPADVEDDVRDLMDLYLNGLAV